ncbi:hypothetical protein BS78_05G113300 [Paspalum vaginatum]|nr:hypothetical protein BS78_05G113300 [Paspalum vaginatum]
MSASTGEGALAPLCLRYPARAPASLPTPRRSLPRLRDSRAQAPWPPPKISPPTPPENPAASHLPRPYLDDPPLSSAPPRSRAPSAAPCQVSAAPPPRRRPCAHAPRLPATPARPGPDCRHRHPRRRASVEPPRASALTADTATPRAAGPARTPSDSVDRWHHHPPRRRRTSPLSPPDNLAARISHDPTRPADPAPRSAPLCSRAPSAPAR